MDDAQMQPERSVPREAVPVCWCLPYTTFGSYLWGTVLVVAGGVWLLNSLELLADPLLQAFWPLLVVGVGVAYLVRAATEESRGWK